MSTLSNEQLKEVVKETYTKVADQSKEENESSCCGSGCGCGPLDEAIMAEDYSTLPGYIKDADLGLGCGLPTQFAMINEGDTVVDLGSGAGNDAFVARRYTGFLGKVIGVDFTEKMIERARANAEKLEYNNVEFRYGDIEALPINDNTAHVVVSNCVLNLVPDKHKAFSETFRILRKGGHFSVSDIVLEGGELPTKAKQAAELYAGCVSGAINKDEYLSIIHNAGFENVKIQKEREIIIPDEILRANLSESEMKEIKDKNIRVLSINVYAEKPTSKTQKSKKEECCGVDSNCC
ncbi:MAG: arsenite methyltransferase [Flammeovirgaceae bacterium]|nr:arsenite methyltransferase [Flammeovirgaceae bacterium]